MAKNLGQKFYGNDEKREENNG
ncbi:hypothetical protein CCACVL1_12500 [Corchorus capsularis]|uniref:Uncharacterized protein n=1 Tax=Corchorus capsularis TaxID=210143 RepID=A0A1R3IFA5_COCAP|nr:hypothetical protein CCACVL1_12500 [Corchorus capsularis]